MIGPKNEWHYSWFILKVFSLKQILMFITEPLVLCSTVKRGEEEDGHLLSEQRKTGTSYQQHYW